MDQVGPFSTWQFCQLFVFLFLQNVFSYIPTTVGTFHTEMELPIYIYTDGVSNPDGVSPYRRNFLHRWSIPLQMEFPRQMEFPMQMEYPLTDGVSYGDGVSPYRWSFPCTDCGNLFACMPACAVCVHACVHASMRACACVCTCMHACSLLAFCVRTILCEYVCVFHCALYEYICMNMLALDRLVYACFMC